MAKVVITLEDTRDDSGKTTVSLDMSGVPAGALGRPQQTAAVRISNKLFDMAASEKVLGSIPACRWQPGTTSVH